MSGSEFQLESGNEEPQRLRHSRRALSRTFVFLEKKLQCVPSKESYKSLKDAGRVKTISFTRNHSAAVMKALFISKFLALIGRDFSW